MTAELTFLHTSDWHLGQAYGDFSPEFSATLREARLRAVERIMETAESLRAAFILVAGDQFDGPNPDPDLVTAMFAAIAAHPMIPVHMIPGNHDPAQPGSAYARAMFARDAPENLHFHRKSAAVALSDRNVTLFPCPCLARFEADDPMAWIPPRSSEDGFRIALAHGSLPSIPTPEGRNSPIEADAAGRYGLDYVALGDWHSANPRPEDHPHDRLYYSGAPEVGGWDETGAGSVLLVTLGDRPKVVRHRIGRFDWVEERRELRSRGDVTALLLDLDRLASPDRLLRLDLAGSLTTTEREALDRGLGERMDGFAAWVAATETLRLAAEGAIDLPRDPLLRSSYDRLSAMLDSPGIRLPSSLPDAAREAIDAEVVERALRTFLDLLPDRP